MAALGQMLLADGRFPAGSHAHSGGLEAAVREGLGPDGVSAFIAGRLRCVAGPEAHLVVAARRAVDGPDLERLTFLCGEAEARCPSPALRLAARRLGSQLVRSACAVWPRSPILRRWPAPGEGAPRPVAFGVVASVAGLDDREAAAAFLYEDAAATAAAAVRLLPVDAVDAARWVAAQEATVAELASAAVRAGDDPGALPATTAPLIELRSLANEREERRLFET
jgi:urease accessory protein